MSRANVSRAVVQRVRITGLTQDVHATAQRYRARGYRWVEVNPLREAGGRISSTRSGATLGQLTLLRALSPFLR